MGWAGLVASPQRAAQAFVVLVCVSVLALTVWRVHLARELALSNSRIDAVNLARSVAEHAHSRLESADVIVTDTVDRLQADGTGNPALARLHRMLVASTTQFPRIRTLLVYDADGHCIVSSTPQPIVGDFSDREYFTFHRDHLGETAHVGPPIQSRANGQWNITLSRRIEAPSGGFGGVAVATLDLDMFAAFYATFDYGANGAIALMHDDGTLLVRSPRSSELIGRNYYETPFFRAYRAHGGIGIESGISPMDGIDRLRAFRDVDGYPLVVFAALAEDDVLAPWRHDSLIAAAAAGVVMLSLGGFGWWLARHIRLRDEAEQAVRRSERQYRLLADNSTDLIVQLDPNFRRVYVSPSSMALLGYAPHELLGHLTIDLANPQDRPALLANFSMLQTDGEAPPVTYRIRHKDGSEIWVELIGRRLVETSGFVITVRDVERRKEAEDALHAANNQLQRIAMLDGLTGIANRRCFDMILDNEFRRAGRGELPVALLLIDVDHFKAFNDTYGHPAGDACLRAIAEAIAQAIRRPGDHAARYGGEEFAALLPGTGEAGALETAARIMGAVRALDLAHRGGVAGRVSVSVGAAVIWPHARAQGAADLVALADAALYRAKAGGRDRVCSGGDQAAAATAGATVAA